MTGSRSTAFIRVTLHRPITMLMLCLTLLVVGTIAYLSTPLQLAPAGIVLPTITIHIPVAESTPREVMENVAEPAEELFRGIAGIAKISSESSANSCRLFVTYRSDVDGDAVYSDVRDRMERLVPSLPEGSDRYRIRRFNLDTDLPIVQMACSFDEDVSDPDTLLENVVPRRFEAIDGVASVDVRGAIAKRVEIQLNSDRVEAYGIDVRELIRRLRDDNVLASGGIVREGGSRYLLRMASRFSSLDELRHYRISASLELADIAKVGYRRAVQNYLVRVDGRLCRVIVVSKESQANSIEVCRRVKRVIEDELPSDPRIASFEFFPFWVEGDTIEDSVSDLKSSCAWGGILAILVLYVFLRRFRLTFVIASVIPMSLLIAATAIYFTGGTFNLLSITGMTIGIGMLIDNAIVIAENIFRCRRSGVTERDAAEIGVREVGLAVTLATATTVAVFLPIVLLGGDSSGRVYLAELGLPVCYSVAASLFVALFFVPLATTYLATTSGGGRGEGGWLRRFGGRVNDGYGRLVAWTLRARMLALLICFGLLATIAFPHDWLSQKGATQDRERNLQVQVHCAQDFTLRDTDQVMQNLREALLPHLDELDVESVVAWYRATGGTCMLCLKPGAAATPADFFERLRPLLPEYPGVEFEYGSESDDEEKQIRIRASGRDPGVLLDLLSETAKRFDGVEGVLDVHAPSDQGNDELVVGIERERAQRYQVQPTSVASLIGWALRGAPLRDFETPEREVEMWINYDGATVEGIGGLQRVQVYSDQFQPVPLANLARLEVEKGLPSIRREGGRVTASIVLVVGKDANPQHYRQLADLAFRELVVPEGYELEFESGGELEATQKEMGQAAMFGALLIFVLMGVLFESFMLPLAVLASVPFLLFGAIWGVYLAGESLGAIAYVGFIILLGVVVNNSIVLIDTIHRYCGDPQYAGDRNAAIVAAGRARLRPIVMTASTTVFGLAPLVFREYGGAGLDYRPLAVVVMGGLTASTAFTLVVVPLFYVMLDDLRSKFAATVSRFRATRPASGEVLLDQTRE